MEDIELLKTARPGRALDPTAAGLLGGMELGKPT
jgi:hypothetical protein